MQIVKPFFTLALIPMLIGACGENSIDNQSSDKHPITAETVTDSIETVDSEQISETKRFEEFSNDTVFQIQDYVALILKEKIYPSLEKMRDGNNSGNFYEKLDAKGGFASVRGAFEGTQEFVMWRMADGDDLIGQMIVECGPACSYAYTFYKGRGQSLIEIDQAEIFPMLEINKHKELMVSKIKAAYQFDYPEDSQLYFSFPQKGTDMRVDVVVGADEMQIPILVLNWNKKRFSIKEKFQKIDPQL